MPCGRALAGRTYGGVASFGVRPTVDNGAPLLEAHLFDFAGDLYGQEMEVDFVARIREERKFASLDALKAEMARDMERARAALAARAIWRFAPNHLIGSPPKRAALRHSPFPARFSMTDAPAQAPDYSQTLYLPKTDFPMRAGLPQKEPEILARWAREGLYAAVARKAPKGRPKFVLHDGPPYANGNIHIGHALNKILKDMVVRSQQMAGKDSNYVPGWDCHGLPIEWKVEEENYRKKGKAKPDFSDAGGDGRVPPGMPRLRRALALACSARSSSAWAWSATGTIPIRR